MSESATTTSPRWQPHVVAFVCRWCSYAGADMAGTSRLSYPAAVRLVRLPCTGRLDPTFIIRAFELGADGVLISGCHPGDCHYVHGNLLARRRFAVFRSLLDLLGLDARRLHFAWVSASEGRKWARVVAKVTEAVREAGPLGGWTHAPLELAKAAPAAPPPQPRRHGMPVEAKAAIEDQIRAHAAELLRDGRVDAVLASRPGSLPEQMIPACITSPREAESIAWQPAWRGNLAAYLPTTLEHHSKVALVARTCDAKAIAVLLQEGQVTRESIFVLGAPCGGHGDAGSDSGACAKCDGVPHVLCDTVVAGDSAGRQPGADARDVEIAWLSSLTAAQRWAYWQKQFARCLRCYACRATCPLCFCTYCVAEKHRPQWIPTSIDGGGNTAWNAIRAYHLAGRCVGCDACARACPAGIRLDLLNRATTTEVERLFAYRSGEETTATPVLATFSGDDEGGFVL